MNKNQLEKLLSQKESGNLDFKSKIVLDSKKGKADFLVEVLGLANSLKKPAYLILGIEDKTKNIVGISGDITEERIQKIIADNCRPPIRCEFEYTEYKGKQIGVLTILGNARPYSVKKEVGFEDSKGKPQHISDKTVFVRRGSTGDTATPEEIAEMFFEREDQNYNSAGYSNIINELDRVSSNLYHIKNSILHINKSKRAERGVEYLFLGIISGVIVGIIQNKTPLLEFITLGWWLVFFGVAILFSVFKVIHFGWVRSLIVSLVISSVFFGLSYIFDARIIQMLDLSLTPYLIPLWGGIKGMVGAILMIYLGRDEGNNE